MLRMFRQIKLKFALAAVTLLFGGVLITVAIVFASMAVYFALLERLTPTMAALATAGLALVFLLVVMLLVRLVAAIAGSRRPDPQRDAAFLGNLVGRRMEDWHQRNSLFAVMAALGAGFVVGMSPRLRGILLDILKR
ncbi:MAG TPA: hypothetical protein VFA91_03905 [Candidatus Polarisedimenticolia bacterium]|nr:hypothetical protein [Candidatus Polarisedimenticolia bacterium]